mmetsp:Transcript_7261/g.23969  ORF Transcript_7261/g.23969 Transcript_7261/m.23969 type:complete len:202 (+) Transcript_7261:491-1096(+)
MRPARPSRRCERHELTSTACEPRWYHLCQTWMTRLTASRMCDHRAPSSMGPRCGSMTAVLLRGSTAAMRWRAAAPLCTPHLASWCFGRPASEGLASRCTASTRTASTTSGRPSRHTQTRHRRRSGCFASPSLAAFPKSKPSTRPGMTRPRSLRPARCSRTMCCSSTRPSRTVARGSSCRHRPPSRLTRSRGWCASRRTGAR